MLYLVPTPVGNLEDMTARSLRALKEAKAVYCEDTRRTRVLMSHFGISTPLLRYQEHDQKDAERLLARLQSGDDLALVSDGGLPCISDPGRLIVSMARKTGVSVTALPGASAVVAAVAGSGLPGDSFVFLGFLPRTASKQRRLLTEAAALGRTIALYESPFRVVDLFTEIETALGPSAQACVVRELSKLHEEWLHGTVAEVKAELAGRKEHLGEFVVILHPDSEESHVRDH
ncbi:MAG: 16S rRNA (cytidine(1402)-2'-O)-methyltransferase [Elusimicrobiota bacterium]